MSRKQPEACTPECTWPACSCGYPLVATPEGDRGPAATPIGKAQDALLQDNAPRLSLATVQPGAGLDVARGPECMSRGIGYYDPAWQRKALERSQTIVPPPCQCFQRRPIAGWSDSGPA